jgi:transposase InsO family protein
MARTSLRPSVRPSPRPTKPLELVQIDHTLVDIMVVDELQRESMGRPWLTIAFDVATRVVLAFILSLNPPSATSVGLALSMAALPKDRWLKDRGLKIRWAPYGVPTYWRAYQYAVNQKDPVMRRTRPAHPYISGNRPRDLRIIWPRNATGS